MSLHLTDMQHFYLFLMACGAVIGMAIAIAAGLLDSRGTRR